MTSSTTNSIAPDPQQPRQLSREELRRHGLPSDGMNGFKGATPSTEASITAGAGSAAHDERARTVAQLPHVMVVLPTGVFTH